MSSEQQQQQHVILFYKYHPLSPDAATMEEYRRLLETLCRCLRLQGRILVAYSRTEGINGTLAGGDYTNVLAFTVALLGRNESSKRQADSDLLRPWQLDAIESFWRHGQAFFDRIGESELFMSSPEDFKWSSTTTKDADSPVLFPDLNVKLVPELIGTGGVLSCIPLEETAVGYLSPTEWHADLLAAQNTNDDETILIDCRNTKEHQIGHFVGSLDPQTTTFAQFPQWVQSHEHLMANKKVRMFCTGGIRCEKASAFIRRHIPSIQDVKHLKGGIHKYLETYGNDDGSLWQGKNFVFDVRGAMSAEETTTTTTCETQETIVGRCVECQQPFDEFDPHCVCTVCREPSLVCRECQAQLMEYHCVRHAHLKTCYFSNLQAYMDETQLERQLVELDEHLQAIAVGRRFRQKRKTLQKQMDRVRERLQQLRHDVAAGGGSSETAKGVDQSKHRQCRNCGDVACTGRCWGYYGLKRKEVLEKQIQDSPSKTSVQGCRGGSKCTNAAPLLPKKYRREQAVQEMKRLRYAMPPSAYRNPETGIRVPPCSTRLLQCATKAKWCGETVLRVVQDEFVELRRPEVLQEIISHGLLRINGRSISALEASDMQLKSSDRIARVLHWHEAPVCVPAQIKVTKVALPDAVMQEYSVRDDALIYVCDKPSSVPVHPAGPYLSNSLTVMVEAQELLEPQSLNPVHRTDRVTSGLTICCTDPVVSRIFHRCLSEGSVRKLYVARVSGKFPASADKAEATLQKRRSEAGRWLWLTDLQALHVDAHVHTVDPANGIRTVSTEGKPSQSLFKCLRYDQTTHTSIIACSPETGRNHQIRVHLQWLGFPIVGDMQYGSTVESTVDLSKSAVDAMVSLASSDERRLDSLSDADIASAKQACPCCVGGRHGMLKSFTEAQLLKHGHSIQLHAVRYSIVVPPKRKKPPTKEPLAVVNLAVELPEWASATIKPCDLP